MFTQENLSTQGEKQSLVLALLALVTILLVKQSGWVWNSLYFQHHTLIEVLIALGSMFVLVIACFALLRLVSGHVITFKLTNVGIALLFSFVVFKFLQQTELIPAPPTPQHKTLAFASGIAAGLLTLKISFDTWKRLHLAVIVGGVIFTLLPILLANTLAPNVYWPSPSHQSPTQHAPKLPAQNTIVLLLDELSASAAGPMVEALQSEGLHVTQINLDPAGKNTINVIPAIWTRSNFDQSVPCGPTQLCSANNVLDFAKVKASSDNIDIVGFYHRYCSIQGLRSCSFEPLPKQRVGTDLVCSFPLVKGLKFLGCNENEADRTLSIALRNKMQNTLLNVPFWDQGGVLYAHLLVPHPLPGIPLKPLAEEYKDNIFNGAVLLKLVAKKAKLVFGSDFKIIVFSDHPLRKEIWCTDNNYKVTGCDLNAEQISNQVPLIIATPYSHKPSQMTILNNRGAFDFLFVK